MDPYTKNLLILTAWIEAITGLILISSPSLLAMLLLGTSLKAPAAIIVARLAGVALVTLGIACWLARSDEQRQAVRRMVAAMLFYNCAAVAVIISARFGQGLSGICLWPAVVLHAGMAVWCGTSIQKNTAAKRLT
jgi:hypothetical protein